MRRLIRPIISSVFSVFWLLQLQCVAQEEFAANIPYHGFKQNSAWELASTWDFNNTTNVGSTDKIENRVEPLAKRLADANLIPGFQIAVCTANGESWNGAYGVADLASGRKVTQTTRFYIASTTKALTGLAAARLNHRGLLDFKQPLSEAFAGVKFPDGFRANDVVVQDLLTHTHGLGQSALSGRVAFLGNYSNEDLRDLIRHLPYRNERRFRYANIGYDLTGILLSPEKTHGWKDVVQKEVLSPFGMTHTTAHRSHLKEEQIAYPHEIGIDGQQRIKLTKFDENMGPAGGHFSTASDLIRLVQVVMADGKIDGQQLIPKEVVSNIKSEIVKQNRRFTIYQRHAWGIGWDIGKVGNQIVVHRPGGFAGYYSNVAFIPEQGVGIVVLGNGGQFSASSLEALTNSIYEEFSGKSEVSRRLDQKILELKKSFSEMRTRAGNRVVEYLDKPDQAIESYVGTYSNSQWGEVTISQSNGKLMFEWGVIQDELRPLERGSGFHVQIIRSTDRAEFEFDKSGSAEKLTIKSAFRVKFNRKAE